MYGLLVWIWEYDSCLLCFRSRSGLVVCAALRTTNRNLQSSVEKNTQAQADAQKLQAEADAGLQAATSATLKAQARASEAETALQTVREQLQASQDETKDWREKCEAATLQATCERTGRASDREQMEARTAAAEAQTTRLQAQVSTLEGEESILRKQLGSLRAQFSALEDDHGALQTEMTGVRRRLSASQSEASEWKAEAARLSTQVTDLTSQLTSQRMSYETQTQAREDRIGELTARLTAERRAKQQAQDAAVDADEVRVGAARELRIAQGRVAELELQLSRAEEKAAGYMEALNAQRRGDTEEVVRLRARLAEVVRAGWASDEEDWEEGGSAVWYEEEAGEGGEGGEEDEWGSMDDVDATGVTEEGGQAPVASASPVQISSTTPIDQNASPHTPHTPHTTTPGPTKRPLHMPHTSPSLGARPSPAAQSPYPSPRGVSGREWKRRYRYMRDSRDKGLRLWRSERAQREGLMRKLEDAREALAGLKQLVLDGDDDAQEQRASLRLQNQKLAEEVEALRAKLKAREREVEELRAELEAEIQRGFEATRRAEEGGVEVARLENILAARGEELEAVQARCDALDEEAARLAGQCAEGMAMKEALEVRLVGMMAVRDGAVADSEAARRLEERLKAEMKALEARHREAVDQSQVRGTIYRHYDYIHIIRPAPPAHHHRLYPSYKPQTIIFCKTKTYPLDRRNMTVSHPCP